jgi:hypothetical protein
MSTLLNGLLQCAIASPFSSWLNKPSAWYTIYCSCASDKRFLLRFKIATDTAICMCLALAFAQVSSPNFAAFADFWLLLRYGMSCLALFDYLLA